MIEYIEVQKILEDEKMNSGEKLERLSLYLPVCQELQKLKKKLFWKLVLEDVCILLLRENFDLKQQLSNGSQTVRVPMMGVDKWKEI